MTQHFSVANSKDGFTLHLTERPWWTGIYETVVEQFLLSTVLRHVLCCNIPEWTYKVPFGKTDYDPDYPLEDGSLTNFNSLGSRLYRGTSALTVFPYNREKTIAWIPISQADAEKVSPGIVDRLVEMGWLPEDEVDPTS